MMKKRNKSYRGINPVELLNAFAESEELVSKTQEKKNIGRRICLCGKITYNSEEDAQKAAKRIKNKEIGSTKYAYKCSECNKFHLASK